jgi:hypothetical protein
LRHTHTYTYCDANNDHYADWYTYGYSYTHFYT